MYNQTSGGRKIFFIALLLIFFIIAINFPPVRDSLPSRLARKVVLGAAYPIQYVFNSVVSGTGNSVGTVFTLWRVAGENAKLRDEVDTLSSRLNLIKDLVDENGTLRKELGFKETNPFALKLLPAEVIARSPSNWFETVIINKGASSGVFSDQPVICREGLVGRVFEVGPFSSKVMLITDPGSSVGVMVKRTRDMGIAAGGAMNSLQVKYVSSASSLEAGDLFITSGVGGVFPKGIPVGVITRTVVRDYDLFRYVELKPLVSFSKLETVFVVTK